MDELVGDLGVREAASHQSQHLEPFPGPVAGRSLEQRLIRQVLAAGDTTEEIDKLRRGGDGHIVVWGGVSFWRSLMQLDLTGLQHRVQQRDVGLHYRRHR